MRNRAKCKLCHSIIESYTDFDEVSCSCGEITIWGGNNYLNSRAKSYDNFLRIDDDKNEIPVKYIEKKEEHSPLSKDELIIMLKKQLDYLEKMPDHAKMAPLTYYDLYAFMLITFEIFKSDSAIHPIVSLENQSAK